MISIIVPNHLNENQKFLDATLRGVGAQRGVEYETIVVSDAVLPPNTGKFSLHYDRALDNMSSKINFAVKNLCSKDTEGYLILSDDTVPSPDYAASLYEVSKWQPMIVSGLSNNDNHRYFYTDFPFSFNVDYSEEAIEYALSQPKGRNILLHVDFTPFIAIYIPKECWDKVGEFDEEMGARGNDVDYCIRATRAGLRSVINLSAFVLHFGSKTICHEPKSSFDMADNAFTKKYGDTIKLL